MQDMYTIHSKQYSTNDWVAAYVRNQAISDWTGGVGG